MARITSYFNIFAALDHVNSFQLQRVRQLLDARSGDRIWSCGSTDDLRRDEKCDLVDESGIENRARYTRSTFNQNTLQRPVRELFQYRTQVRVTQNDHRRFRSCAGELRLRKKPSCITKIGRAHV